MRINDRLVQLKAVAFAAAGFIQRHKRAPVATSVALLIAGPCSPAPAASRFPPTPYHPGQILVGLGIVALVVRWTAQDQ